MEDYIIYMKDKKNIVVILGSSQIKSITETLVDDLIKRLEIRIGKQNVIKHRADELLFCKGCARCFHGEKCNLDTLDDMMNIKNDLIKADIIILATPTYFKDVSGQMKVFIDRTSYMTHLFALAGKTGILIATGSCNGVDEAIDYMDCYAKRLGLINLKKVILKRICDSQKQMEIKLDNLVQEIFEDFKCNSKLDISTETEEIFQIYKKHYKNTFNKYEQKYLIEMGIEECSSFEEFILNNK